MRLRVLYEDNHVLVAEKAGRRALPGGCFRGGRYAGHGKGICEGEIPKARRGLYRAAAPVGSPGGGADGFARTSKAAARLSEEIRQGRMRKGYLAIVRAAGLPEKKGAWKIIFTRTPGRTAPGLYLRGERSKVCGAGIRGIGSAGAGRWRASNCSPGGRTRSACNFPPGLAAVGRCKIRQRRARPGAILLFSRVCAPDAQGADGVFPAAGHRSFCRIYLWNGKT